MKPVRSLPQVIEMLLLQEKRIEKSKSFSILQSLYFIFYVDYQIILQFCLSKALLRFCSDGVALDESLSLPETAPNLAIVLQ